MAIASIDNLIAAYPGQLINFYRSSVATSKGAGMWQSMFGQNACGGMPGTGIYPGAGTAWSVRTSALSGALPFTNPVTGSSYLAGFRIAASAQALFVLYDRLAHTSSITPAASTQTTASVALTRPDSLGADVELWWEWLTASSASPASDFTCSYTNQAGVAGRTTQAIAGQTTSVPSQLQQLPLQAGDTGVRTVESFTGTGAIGGTGQLVLLRRISDLQVTNIAASADPFTTGMPRIYDSAALSLMWVSYTATTQTVHGSIQVVQG